MFNNGNHYKTYKVMLGLLKAQDKEGFVAHLGHSFSSLVKDKDELRMLYYITRDSSDDMFDYALRFYELHRDEIEDCAARIGTLYYALAKNDITRNSRANQIRDRLQSNPNFALSSAGFSEGASAG